MLYSGIEKTNRPKLTYMGTLMSVKMIVSKGWDIESESPLEIRHRATGSYATGVAATIVSDSLMIPMVGEMIRIETGFAQDGDEFEVDEIHHVISVDSVNDIYTIDNEGMHCFIHNFNFRNHCVIVSPHDD